MIRYCVDASPLLRLQDVNWLEHISTLSGCTLLVTDVVWSEVATTQHTKGAAAAKALTAATNVQCVELQAPSAAMARFARLRARYPPGSYHDGELSVIALAAEDASIIPVVFELRGYLATCEELRRPAYSGHWFFYELFAKHGMPRPVLDEVIDVLVAKRYPKPTWLDEALGARLDGIRS